MDRRNEEALRPAELLAATQMGVAAAIDLDLHLSVPIDPADGKQGHGALLHHDGVALASVGGDPPGGERAPQRRP